MTIRPGGAGSSVCRICFVTAVGVCALTTHALPAQCIFVAGVIGAMLGLPVGFIYRAWVTNDQAPRKAFVPNPLARTDATSCLAPQR